MQFDYTITTSKDFKHAVGSVVQAAGEAGFRVLAVHDFAATLAEKGFEREDVSLVEVCNAKYASQVLAADVKIGLMLPCPIMVYAEQGRVYISTMLPTIIGGFFPDANITDVASQVEAILVTIVDTAAAH